MTMEKTEFYKKTILLLVLLLLWNPITLWLLSKSLLISIAITVGLIILYFLLDTFNNYRLKVWFFNLLMIGSVLFHSELVFRTLFFEKDIPNLYDIRDGYYFNKPLLEQTFNNEEYFSIYRTNIQGYRIDNETNNQDSIRNCDWLFIGDSFTQGAQVDYSQLFTSIIYKDFCDKIIVNAGISGAGICDELKYYKDEGYKLNPKKVFLQIGVFNDFYNVYERYASWQDYLIDISSLYRFAEYNLTSSTELKLGRWTEPFAPTLEENANYNILYKTSSEIKRKDLQMFEKYLAEFNNVVRENGAELIVLLIPSKEQISEKCFNEVIEAYNIDKKDIDLEYPSLLMEDLSQKYNFKLIDLHQDFISSSHFPFYNVDEHMNAVGHQVIANRLRKEFSDIMAPYTYLSKSNANERYPMIYDNGFSLLYQYYANGKYHISFANSTLDNVHNIVTSVNELIHPMFSNDRKYLVFTEGNQDLGNTNIILYNLENNTKEILTSNENEFGAIPQFNKAGTKIVYASWNFNNSQISSTPTLSIYDIETKETNKLELGETECWRPVFHNDDKSILYITKSPLTNVFVICSYALNTKEVTKILECPYDIWDISISPSERFIAYSGNNDGNWDLYLYDSIKKTNTQLTDSSGDEWDSSFGSYDNEIWFAGTAGINNGIYYITLDETIIGNN